MFDRGGPAGVCDRVSDAAVGAEAAQRELTAGVVDLVRSGAHEIDGARSAVRWLILRCGLGERDARRLVRRARLLLGVPVVADRFDAGRLGVAMLDVLAGAVTPERVDVACRDAVVLCDAAETAADVAGFELVMRRWVTLADDHLACVDSAAVYDGRYCYASRSLFGSLELNEPAASERLPTREGPQRANRSPGPPPKRLLARQARPCPCPCPCGPSIAVRTAAGHHATLEGSDLVHVP